MIIFEVVAEYPDGTETKVSRHYSEIAAHERARRLNRGIPHEATGGFPHGFPEYVVRKLTQD